MEEYNRILRKLNTDSIARSVHPYEEPAIDIVPLLDESNF